MLSPVNLVFFTRRYALFRKLQLWDIGVKRKGLFPLSTLLLKRGTIGALCVTIEFTGIWECFLELEVLCETWG